ncbi:MAG: Holliday junction resolvase RuvX [Cellvibrionales bacterium]|nr:Holliday junction resolvase RuvX [Cellvibrionales bacterium]
MSNTGERLLAFDFGVRRIGVATGNTVSGTSSALTTLQARGGGPPWSQIEQILDEWRVDRCLVGLPLHMDGSESEISGRARQFADELRGRFTGPVDMVDERLSSFVAREQIQASERRARVGEVDAQAAKLLVDQWLHSRGRL